MPFDPSSPASVLGAFVRTRASLDPDAADSVVAFRGHLYGVVPSEGARPLLWVEGFSIGRAVATEKGFDLLTREMAVYRHAAGGPVAESFPNPYTGRVDRVHQVWNDPVNRVVTAMGLTADVIGDAVHFTADDFACEANPLPPATWPYESTGALLECIELARWSSAVSALEADGPSVPCQFSCTRHEPWLPWMRMGGHQGGLVTHIGGTKLAGGYGALPGPIRAYMEELRPEFAFAPRSFVSPNESSWTVYAKEQHPYAL